MCLLAMAFLFPIAQDADSASSDDLSEAIRAAESRFSATFQNARVDHVTSGPMPGLYEIQVGSNLLYFAPEHELLFIGEIWTPDGRSLTAERRAELDRARLTALDLSQSLTLPGTGTGDVVEFVDPDCPYCARLNSWFEARPDVSRHLFFVPLDTLHPDAAKRAVHVLCSDSPREALNAIYTRAIPNADLIDCPAGRARLDAQREVARSIGVDATPTLFIGPARQRVNGFQPRVLETVFPLPSP